MMKRKKKTNRFVAESSLLFNTIMYNENVEMYISVSLALLTLTPNANPEPFIPLFFKHREQRDFITTLRR
jgi:hypothetical protein